DDFDQEIINWMVDEFMKQQGIDLSKDPMALQRLKEAAERAKCELSTTQSTNINLPFVTADSAGAKHLDMTLSRAKLEQLVDHLIQRTVNPCKSALKDSGFDSSQVDDVLLVGGQTRMPMVQKKVTEIFGKEPHKGVNPDEVVAVGAAIQAGVLSGDVKDVLLLDVTPLTLGIETLGGVATAIIDRNTTIPTKKSQVFSTAADNQPQVEIIVLQGERKMAADNRAVGRFVLDGIPPAPRGLPQIEVTFDIDANGILHVLAKDKATGKEQKIRIEASSGLSEEEIKGMVHDAEVNAEEDVRKREIIERRNHADALVFEIEKQLKDIGDKIEPADKSRLEDSVSEMKKALDGEDDDIIKQKFESLQETWKQVGTAFYQKQQAGEASQPTGEAGEPDSEHDDDKTIDADYEVVDD
ncbi:MAG: Hsp70 family protein, partial [Candidatus Fermentibacteraceae bacterium]|nr:Hsp70 family protein [Candidatus Fermentibacteraceae bacterium]